VNDGRGLQTVESTTHSRRLCRDSRQLSFQYQHGYILLPCFMVLILSGLQSGWQPRQLSGSRRPDQGQQAGTQAACSEIGSLTFPRLTYNHSLCPSTFQHHQRPTFKPRFSSLLSLSLSPPSPLHPSPAAASRSAFPGCLRDISTQTLFLTRPVCSHQTSLPLTPTAFTLSSQLHILCALPARSIHTLHYTPFTAVFPVF
jgi:hypothetical protein